MAIFVIQEFEVEEDDLSTDNYDGTTARLNAEADPPQGMLVHTAGFTGKGTFCIADVWESEEDWVRFRDGRLAEALKPMMESGEGSPPTVINNYELHNLIRP